MAKGYVFYFHHLMFFFVYLEPGLSQKTFLRSKLEMPRSLRLSRIPELLLRKIELPLESSLVKMPKSTTTSTLLLMLLSSKPRETPRLRDHSTSKLNQRLLSLSELEGKLSVYNFENQY